MAVVAKACMSTIHMKNDATLTKRVAEMIKANPRVSLREMARSLNAAHRRVRRIRDSLASSESIPLPQTALGTLRKGVPVEQFRQQFDVPLKIRTALKSLQGVVISDNDFRTELGISSVPWSAARTRQEFTPYQITIRSRLYWSSREGINRIRDTVDAN